MDTQVTTAHTSIDALPLHCGGCKQRHQAAVLAMYDGLCRRCSERRAVPRCAACHAEARGQVLWRFGGVCRACHFNRRWPDLARAGDGESSALDAAWNRAEVA